MYCGCNEIALSSQSRIAGTLLSLMERKPFSSITVSELCREAGVSRPTFYSLFGSMEDVVLYILKESYCYAPGGEHVDGCGLAGFCYGYSGYIASHRDFLSLLMQNGLFHIVYGSIEESLSACDCFLPGAEPELRRTAAHFAAGGLAGFIQSCTLGEPYPADAMSVMLEKLFTGAFF